MKSSVQCAWLALVVAILGLLGSCRISAQSSLAVPREIDIPDGLGRDICALNDVDGDHCADFALDDRREWIWVVSGKTGRVVARLHTGATSRIFSLGFDLNGDGANDLAACSCARDGGLCVRSGRTLEVIRRFDVPEYSADAFFGSIAVGDWDGDQVPDLIVQDRRQEPNTLTVFSCGSGAQIARLAGRFGFEFGAGLACGSFRRHEPVEIVASYTQSLGWEQPPSLVLLTSGVHRPLEVVFDVRNVIGPVAIVPDADGDGWDDVLVLRDNHQERVTDPLLADSMPPADEPSGLALCSSRSRRTIRILQAFQPSSGESVAVARLPDLDGDGVDEIGAAFDIPLWGSAEIFSGRTLALLRTHAPEETTPEGSSSTESGRFAGTIVALADIDGDAVGDYAIGSTCGDDKPSPGCVALYSGKTGKLLRVVRKRGLVP